MKSLVELLVHILQDCGMRCGANPSRDILTVTRRTLYEGDSFLTITLPSFAQGFERSLEQGFLSPAPFPKFSFGRGTGRPRFLGGFLERIFGPDGVLLDDASSDCVFAVRHICLAAKKLNSPCTARREKAAEFAYIDCERSLRSHVVPYDWADTFRRVSRIIWSSVLDGSPYGDPYASLVPRHGPGTTVEGLRGNQKYRFPSWPQRLENEFPFAEYGIGSIHNFSDGYHSFPPQPTPRDETPVKVVFVPKTQKTPRVIAMEPVCMQYIQQSITTWLKPRIEHLSLYTSGRVNFTRQDINAKISLSSSIDRRYATIDMSEASDRVSAVLVRDMLEVCPTFRRQLFACRSTRAKLPSGEILTLRKFASMGSANCFPIEAMAFFCAIVAIRVKLAGVRISPRSVLKYSSGVYVYGDDIIVPTDEAPSVCDNLEAYGFKVNKHKSFWNGNFRESCGMDAFRGIDVTPTYIRRELPADRTDAHGLASAVALSNQFYLSGLWGTARFIRNRVERLLGELPGITIRSFRYLERVIEGSNRSNRELAGLGWISFSNAESFNGWSKTLQCLKSKRWIVSPVRRRDPLEGDAALLKCFGVIGSLSISPTHLRESVRYGNLALKRRWITL